MSNRYQTLITALLLAIISVWAYFYQFETTGLLDRFDFHYPVIWQEPWRLVTAHFMHLSQPHVLANVIAFVFITWLFVRFFSVRTYLNALLVITVTTSVLVWLSGFEERFVGLSAVNHGLLAMGLLLEWFDHEQPRSGQLVIAAAAILVLKLVVELLGWWQNTLVTTTDKVWLLHSAGTLSGILAWWLHQRRLAKLAS